MNSRYSNVEEIKVYAFATLLDSHLKDTVLIDLKNVDCRKCSLIEFENKNNEDSQDASKTNHGIQAR